VSIRMHRSTARAAAIAGSLVLVGAMAAPAHAADAGSGNKAAFDWSQSSYILTVRSGGLETFAHIPRDLPQDAGYSFVELVHDTGQSQGQCESWGAGYWLGQEVEEGVLGAGAAPPDAGDVSGGYRNPTTSRQVRPNLSAGDSQSDRHPALHNYFPPGNDVYAFPPEGPGYKWTAKCDNDLKGQGQGDVLNVGGIQAVGSTAQAAVDKATGVYTATSRSYVVGIEGAAGFDSASSFMQITNRPDKDATVTYRMSYFNSGDLNKPGKNGITFGGTDIPVEQFADQFNSNAKTFGSAIAAVGPAGAATLQPEVGVSTDGNRYSITISAGHGNLGLAARAGGLGENQGMRLGAITFQGVYGQNS